MSFEIDKRIADTCFELGDWPVSRVMLKNNALFPWLILIPRVADVTELDELPQKERYLLMDEISQLSSIVRSYFKTDKINIGLLGNIVSQLHIHIVGRFKEDEQWPHGIWQMDTGIQEYSAGALQRLLRDLGELTRPYSPD